MFLKAFLKVSNMQVFTQKSSKNKESDSYKMNKKIQKILNKLESIENRLSKVENRMGL